MPGPGKPDCPLCRGLGYYGYDVPVGHSQFGKAYPCPCRSEELAAWRAQQAPALANLLPGELHVRVEHLQERGEASRAMLAEVRRFAAEPYGMLTLWGGVGTGKTLALQALTNRFREQNPAEAVYVVFKDLVDWVRQGNAKDATEDATRRYQRICEVRFLAIDEIDKARMTDFAFEFRTGLLDRRYRLAREQDAAVRCHTVLAMNENPAALPDYIYDRLRWGVDDPLEGFRIVENRDESARPAGL